MIVSTGRAQEAAQLLSARSPSLTLPAGGNGDSVDPQTSPDGRFVLFNSTAANLVPNSGGQLASQVYLRDRWSNTTTLVSVNLSGFPGNGNSTYGGMSPDGRFVVFASDASDLAPGDTNGFSDIFVRDLMAGTTTLASVSTNSVEGNGPSSRPVMTPDGRFVAFVTTASNLASAHENPDLILRDRTGQTTAAMGSAAPSGTPNGAAISSLSISTNGRYVAFASDALHLVFGVTQPGGEVYVRDFVGGGIIWASSNATTTAQAILGGHALPTSEHPVMSDDGTWVAFKTGSNTISGGSAVIFRYNTGTGSLATVFTNGIYAMAYDDDRFGPEMTPDGRFIVFTAGEQGATTNGSIVLWDAETASNTLVSTNLSGEYSSNTLAQEATMTPDGRYVVFLSDAEDLTGATVLKGSHIFRCDRQTGAMTLLDADTNGVGSTDFMGMALSVSTNGQFVFFSGPDGSLVPLDINAANDVFVRDATGGTTQLISQRDRTAPTRAGDRYSSAGPLSISADGRWVAFASYATDLVPNDTNSARDIFVCDRWSGSNFLVSVGANGGSALGGDSLAPEISTNGQYVVFVSAATNLMEGDTITNAGTYNIYRRDLQTQTTMLISVSTNGEQSGDNDSTYPFISQDGQSVAFLTLAHNLAPGLTGSGPSTLWYNLKTGTNVVLAGNAIAADFGPTMSADGRYVAYANTNQLYVWDSAQGLNIYSNIATSAVISPDGSRLLYDKTNNTINVRDLGNGADILTVTNAQKIRSPGVWSGDGRYVALVTTAAISGLATNGVTNVYLADLLIGTQILVSVNTSQTESGNAASDWPTVSWNGRFVAFRSFSTNIVAHHTNAPDLYLYDRVTGTNSLLTTEQPASDWMQRPSKPVISVDVSSAVFQSFGSGLGIGHINRTQDVFAAIMPLAANADSDGDGIPDWWMVQNFGHLTGQFYDGSLAQDDPNGTGMTTWQDYIAGTNPNDSRSIFQAAAEPPVIAGGNVTLVWDAVANRSYSVQFKDSLNDTVWQTLPGNPTINGSQGQFSVATDQANRYYRIVVAAP